MHKAIGFLLACAVLSSPFPAMAQASCPMTTPMAMAPAFSAQAHSCCPQGACPCRVETPSPFQAVSETAVSADAFPVHLWPPVSDSTLSGASEIERVPASESPPGPDKAYKLTSQYRI